VVVPYLWMGGGSPILPGDQWQILCANPNNPAGPIPDTVDDHCRIVIHPFDNRFEFHFGDDKAGRPIFWTGSNVNGGRLLAVPFSQLSEQPVTLGDEIFALLGSSVLVILAGGAETSQLTDEKGRSLFTTREIPDGTGTRTIRVVHPELSARIPNLMPVVHREASPVSQRPEVYYWQRDAGPLQGHKAADTSAMELHHDIQAPAGTPYRYTVCSTTSMTSISADRGSPAGHRVSLHNLGAATQKIVIHSPNDAGASPTNFRVQTAGWQVDRGAPIWFEFGASIAPGQQLHFHVGNAGTQLTVQSANADAVLDLQMFTRATDPAAPPISATRSQIPIPAGQVLRFDPLSWTRDDLAAGKVNRAVLAAFGSATVLNKTTI
jgi:hypothetical protein